jgi:crotonobetainyl-CoA:carnitine CoA-transferase CaiB-like acyl-CoA transferase
LYKTADGWIAIAARGEAMAERLASCLGIAGELAAPRAQWSATEAKHLVKVIGKQSTAAILSTLKAANVWAVRCESDLDTLLRDPWWSANGMVLESDDPTLGHLRQIGSCIGFDESPLPREGRGMLDTIGGHTREVLAEVGYTATEIDNLFARKVVA